MTHSHHIRQGMLKEMRTIISSSAAATTTSAAAVADPSALISQEAETEYRQHAIETNEDNAMEEMANFEEVAENVRREEVEANLLAEQEAGVAAVVAAAETQKRSLEQELEQAGATVEEKQVGSGGASEVSSSYPSKWGVRLYIYESRHTLCTPC